MPTESDVFGAGKTTGGTTAVSASGASGNTGNLIGSTGGNASRSSGGAVSGGTANGSQGGTPFLGTAGGTGRPSTGGSTTLAAGGQDTVGGAGTGGRVTVGGTGGASGGTSSTSVGPNSGLIAHLRFDETQGTVAVNSIDATKSATYRGNCLHPSGVIDGAVSIRNSDKQNPDWIELPTGLLQGLSAATIAVWIRDLSPTRDGGRLFDLATSAAEEFYFVPVDNNPSTANKGCHLFGTSNGSVFVDLWTPTPITNGISAKWQHVAIGWSTDSITLYVDGASVGVTASPGVLPSSFGATTTNWLGRTLNDAYYALYADFDDFRVYNRALTALEIARLYQLR